MSSDHLEKQYTKGQDGAPLSRQITVTLNPEEYERLFFQPSPPRGDLAKRLGMLFSRKS